MKKVEKLREELNKVRKKLKASGVVYDQDNYAFLTLIEEQYRNCVEHVFKNSYNNVTSIDIFDELSLGTDDSKVIDLIVEDVENSLKEEKELKLPKEVVISAKEVGICNEDECSERLGDLLCDKYGFCHFGFDCDVKKDENGEPVEYVCKNIEWDTSECLKEEKELNRFEEEDKILTEGTSNFPWRMKLPLLVFFDYDEFIDKMDNDYEHPKTADFEVEVEDGRFEIDYNAYEDAVTEFEEKFWDENEICVLTSEEQEELEDRLYDFNDETKRMADDLFDEDNSEDYYALKDIKLSIEPGYYEGAYIACSHEDYFEDLSEEVKSEQKIRFENFFKDLQKEFGLTKLALESGPASNGETNFKIVNEESLEEKKKKKGVHVTIGGDSAKSAKVFNHMMGVDKVSCEGSECAIAEEKDEKFDRCYMTAKKWLEDHIHEKEEFKDVFDEAALYGVEQFTDGIGDESLQSRISHLLKSVFHESLKEGIGIDDYIMTSKQKFYSYEDYRKQLVKEFNEKVKEFPYWVVSTSEAWDPEGLNISNDSYTVWYAGTKSECKKRIYGIHYFAKQDPSSQKIEHYKEGESITIYYPDAISRATYFVMKNDGEYEEKEYLNDKVTEVLDDYGILYDDIVENDDGSVNIVGVDEDEWDEVVEAIKAELDLDVIVPDEDHAELENELIVMKESLIKEAKNVYYVCVNLGGNELEHFDDKQHAIEWANDNADEVQYVYERKHDDETYEECVWDYNDQDWDEEDGNYVIRLYDTNLYYEEDGEIKTFGSKSDANNFIKKHNIDGWATWDDAPTNKSLKEKINKNPVEIKVGDQGFIKTGSPFGKKGYTVQKVNGDEIEILSWDSKDSRTIKASEFEVKEDESLKEGKECEIKLTVEEKNMLDKLTHKNKMDAWFWIDDETNTIRDLEDGEKVLDTCEAILDVADGTEDIEEFLEPEEIELFNKLVERCKSCKELKENESLKEAKCIDQHFDECKTKDGKLMELTVRTEKTPNYTHEYAYVDYLGEHYIGHDKWMNRPWYKFTYGNALEDALSAINKELAHEACREASNYSEALRYFAERI